MDSVAANVDRRPGLAIVSDHVTPYRAHLHARIARELPHLRLFSVFVGVRGELNWSLAMPPETNPLVFDGGRDGVFDLLGWSGARKGVRILRQLRDAGVETIVVNGYYRPSLLAMLVLGRRFGMRVFLRADSNIACDRPRGAVRAWIKRALVPLVYRRCDAFMPMGTLGQAYFERYGAPRERCFWVPYEPEYAFHSRADPQRLADFRAAHALDVRRRRILFVGRVATDKRVDLLLAAFERIALERPDWDVVIVGEGPLRRALEAAVPAALRSRMSWLGFQDVEGVRCAYHSCDVLAVPSDHEPWAVVVNEAVAAGLVVVASDIVGAARELVSDRVSGRIVAAGDVEAWRDALLEVTEPSRHAELRDHVPAALAAWRRRADPVEGIRAALAAQGAARG